MISVIGSDLTVVGNLTTSGDIRVEGFVEGDVRSRALIVGMDGCVEGRVLADAVEVHGAVRGRIIAERVTMGSTARVVGKVFHHVLNVEPGAAHEGLKPWRPASYFATGTNDSDGDEGNGNPG